MFHFFRTRKNAAEEKNPPVFHANGIIDVANFGAASPDEPLGYMCGCDISVFQNGQIEIRSADSVKELLESISVSKIVYTGNNINNFDPMHETEVSLMTERKNLRISFQTEETKLAFCNVLITVHRNLKKHSI